MVAERQDHKSIHAHFHLYLTMTSAPFTVLSRKLTDWLNIQYWQMARRNSVLQTSRKAIYIFHHGRTHLHKASVSHTVDHGQLRAGQTNKTTINISFVFWNITSCRCSSCKIEAAECFETSIHFHQTPQCQSQRRANFRVACVRNLNPKNCNTCCSNFLKKLNFR